MLEQLNNNLKDEKESYKLEINLKNRLTRAISSL